MGKTSQNAFGTDVGRALGELRASLTEVLEVVGKNQGSASGVARSIGVDRKLAWQIFRMVKDPDAFAGARDLPGKSGMTIFLNALSGAGVPPKLLGKARRAAAEYESLVLQYAGDRAIMNAMLASMTSPAHAVADVTIRRASFRSNVALWGEQTRVQIRVVMLAPNKKDTSRRDDVQIRGLLDLKRLRADATRLFSRSVGFPARLRRKKPDKQPWSEPVDPEATTACGGVPLLGAYCSSPLPQTARKFEGPIREDLILPGHAGRGVNSTLITAEVHRGWVRRYAYPDEHENCYPARVGAPCKLLVFDLLLHKSLVDGAKVEARTYGALQSNEMNPENLLRLQTDVVRLERGVAGAAFAEFPKHGELLTYVIKRVGWLPADFAVYRVRVEYPVLPSTVFMIHTQP